ncbi:MAG: hypothetical protein U0527_12830 [Candidatus Eisenbacteria bacterium]
MSKNLRFGLLGAGLVIAGVAAFVWTSNAGNGSCPASAGACGAKATQASMESCCAGKATQASMGSCTAHGMNTSMGSCSAVHGMQASMGGCCDEHGARMQTGYDDAKNLGGCSAGMGSCGAHGASAGMCADKAGAGSCSAMGMSAGMCADKAGAGSCSAMGMSAGMCADKAGAGSCSAKGASAGGCEGKEACANAKMTTAEFFPEGTSVTRVQVPGGVDMVITSNNIDAVYTALSQRVAGCKTGCGAKGDCGASCSVARSGDTVVLSVRGGNAENCCVGKMTAGLPTTGANPTTHS